MTIKRQNGVIFFDNSTIQNLYLIKIKNICCEMGKENSSKL
jgi:hypothetical protein